MEKPLSDIVIQRIEWYTPTVTMTFRVGQSIKIADTDRATISRIIRSENNHHYFGDMVYIIYGRKEGVDEGEFILRYLENIPVAVVCQSEEIC